MIKSRKNFLLKIDHERIPKKKKKTNFVVEMSYDVHIKIGSV